MYRRLCTCTCPCFFVRTDVCGGMCRVFVWSVRTRVYVYTWGRVGRRHTSGKSRVSRTWEGGRSPGKECLCRDPTEP